MARAKVLRFVRIVEVVAVVYIASLIIAAVTGAVEMTSRWTGMLATLLVALCITLAVDLRLRRPREPLTKH